MRWHNSHWVRSPKEERVSRDGNEELANAAALTESACTTVDNQVPDDDKVGNASNSVPSPLLCSSCAVGSEQTSDDHDQVSNNSHEHCATVHACKEHKVDEKKRSGNRPIDVTGPVNLAVDIVVGWWDALLVVLGDRVVLPGDTGLGCHTKVGNCSCDGNQGSDDVVETAFLLSLVGPGKLDKDGELTILTVQDMAANAAEASVITTKTTLARWLETHYAAHPERCCLS